MHKVLIIILLMLFCACTETKEVVAISPQEDGTVELFTETSSKWLGAEVARFEGSTLTDKPAFIINNEDGTVTAHYKDGREYTAPLK